MEHENISALRIDLRECTDGKAPRDYIGQIEPENAIARAWIPQTIGDQIWVMWKFDTQDQRTAFESGLPGEVSRWLDRDVIEHALPYGWHIRDANGFV